MKVFIALLVAGLQLAAGLPQHDHGTATGDHDHGTPTTSVRPTTQPTSVKPSVTVPAPSPTGAAPTGCKVIAGDAGFPNAAAFSAALPGVVALPKTPDAPRPEYQYTVKTYADVQAAVKFAAKYNIRLSVLNSGHDFLGRNDAPSGLSIDIGQLGGVRVLAGFTPSAQGAQAPLPSANVISPQTGVTAAVTFGAGVSTQQLNDALAPSKLMTIGAAHGSVKTAGGWGQTAGHAPLSSRYGLGVDQALEYKVVTAAGDLVVANKVANSDLFWALRGGGGGNFGIVVEATVKAHPTVAITVTNWWLNATNAANPGQGFWDSVAYLHNQFPALNAKGVQGYYYVYPNAMKGIFLTAGADAGTAKAKAIWDPVLAKLQSYAGIAPVVTKFAEYKDYKEYFDARFGPICPESGGHGHKLLKRHGDEPMGAPMGIIPMDSRLLGASHLANPNLASLLKAALPNVPQGQLRGHLTAGGKVLTSTEDTSVLPAWRKAYVHLIATGAGAFMSDSLRTLAPDSGAYINEAHFRNPDWKKTFFGEHYTRLSSIKTKYDPNGVFWVTPGVNADHFEVTNGRVCRVTPKEASIAPANDNKNIAKSSGDNEDGISAFPGTVPGNDDGHDHDHGGSCDSGSGEDPDDHEHPGTGGEELPPGIIIEPQLDASKPPTTSGAKLVKYKYGPYTIKAMGMVPNRPVTGAQLPCTNCYITAINAGLEYADGTTANVDTGMWLHHTVLTIRGTGKKDLVCGGNIIGSLMGSRVFASGNERTVMRLNGGKNKYGLKINSGDRPMIIVDLMNEASTEKTAYLTFTYEYVQGTAAAGYKEANVAWLDVGGCLGSDIAAKEGAYDLTGPVWKSTVNGNLIYATGHVHDGGTETRILLNGKVVCTSVQVYGRRPGFISPGGGDGHGGHKLMKRDGGHAGATISDAGACRDFGTVKKGDSLQVVAHYDTNKYPLAMGHDGESHGIMGISRAVIGLL